MKAMLKEVNIDAFAALVGAGSEEPPVRTEYVNDPFNHVILCVPIDGDTTWIECTADHLPAGYLGNFTEGRYVLLACPDGGKLVKTPSSSHSQNLQYRKASIFLEENGNAKVEVETIFKGNQQQAPSYYANSTSEKDQEDWLREKIDASSFDINSFAFTSDSNTDIPSMRLNYTLTARKWGNPSGSRIFLKPNVLEQHGYIPPKSEDREQAVVFHHAFLEVDTISYHLPSGFSVESIPEEPTIISSEFGEYQASVELIDPQTLVYIRKLKMEKIRLPAAYYKEVRAFFKSLSKADKMQVVLSRKS